MPLVFANQSHRATGFIDGSHELTGLLLREPSHRAVQASENGSLGWAAYHRRNAPRFTPRAGLQSGRSMVWGSNRQNCPMRTGYKVLRRWGEDPPRRKRCKPKPPPQRVITVDVPGVGPCMLLSQWEERQLRKGRPIVRLGGSNCETGLPIADQKSSRLKHCR